MGKGKLAKFADMETFANVFQRPYRQVEDEPFAMRGLWHEQYFHNQRPIVLELGCGRGEYTVGLARSHPERNFIGVDIKGARMWTGAKEALEAGMENVAFLRTNIEAIDRFFAPGEVAEIWLTFSDPQMKSPRKRLTSTTFLERYRHFLTDGGTVHLKTDSLFLYTYTRALIEASHLPLLAATSDLYHGEEPADDSLRAIQTYYERMWMDRGITIKYLKFALPHASTLAEPDIDIPLDEYRSYQRVTRSPKSTGK